MPVPTPTSSSTPSSSTSEDGQQQPLASHDTRIEESSEQVPGGQTSSDSQNASESKLPPGKSTPQQNWARMQRERERRQREERERIKAQIRHDHAERRRGEEIRRQSGDDPTINDHSTKKPSSSSEVRIQVRTFDGSTFRSTFPKGATIGDQIRPWIDSSIEQTAPYTLKIILTPRPNKTIEAAEEGKSLEDLEIVGSCTLVMNPVKEYVESYAPTGSDTVGSAVSGGYNLLSSSVGAVFGGVRSMLGLGQTITPQGPLSAPQGPSSRPASGQVRVRTLADQRIEAQKEDQQFYNGNQLNFEPRKDDDTDKSL